MKDGKKTSFFLTKRCSNLLRLLAKELGISQSSVIEILVREKAKAEEISEDSQGIQD